jgi:hypothetical protein
VIRKEKPVIHGPYVTQAYDTCLDLIQRKPKIRRRDVTAAILGSEVMKSKDPADKNRRKWMRQVVTNALDQLVHEGKAIATYSPGRTDRFGHKGGPVKYWVFPGRRPKTVEVP